MIKIDRLSHRHQGQSARLLVDLSLEVPGGQSLALLGRSGSGKSTLLNLIAGIELIQSGELQVAGESMHDRNDNQRTLLRRHHIGVVYQFFNLLPTLTVAQNLALPLELNAVPAAQASGLVKHWLQRIGLQRLGSNYPDTLSGGEQQRVAIARALIHKPGLLLADEPTGNLDADSAGRALDLLLEGTSQLAQTLVLVTHSRSVAERCDRVLTLHQGELREGLEGVAW